MLIQPVVLSGGSGTRLWPLSREKYPKQLLPLIGDDSMLQATVRRLEKLGGAQVAPPMIVCNEEYRFVIAEQLRLMGRPGSVLLEPIGRNTAPALTLAALVAARDGAGIDPVLLVMPADHVITDVEAFQAVVRAGAALAASAQVVVTFGITPDAPETGYGYIQAGAALVSDPAAAADCFEIARFVEKPDAATAQAYLDAGGYYWNSGLFMMRASVWLAAMNTCRPDILRACERAVEQGTTDGEFVHVDRAAFAACPSDSIDYAVMERLAAGAGQIGRASAHGAEAEDAGLPRGMNAEDAGLPSGTDSENAGLPRGVVLPLSAGWSDVGAWDALWRVLPKDDAGNATAGDVLLHDCRDVLALSGGRLVACIGMQDVVVVETPDAILVSHKDRTQDVKKVVEQLKATQRGEGQTHRKVFRPWGWYDSVDQGGRFQVKRIVVKPGGTLSLQMHHHRAEHWIVVSGTAKVTKGDAVFLVSENESTYIPLGTKHRLENPGRLPLEMIEVQSGSYLGEDDIVRFEDVYGR